MTQNFTPLLSTVDWNEEWKALQVARRRADDATYWNKRAKTFSSKDSPSSYVDRFLALANIREHETVFDMGCGAGNLSIPLGLSGHKVVAADFSEGMLHELQRGLTEKNVTTVFPKLMSWSDDWESSGVREGMVDVALASRSIATADLADSLMRLDNVARRRVCITLPTGSSPRIDERALRAIGVPSSFGNDFHYAFSILVNKGILPEVSYISTSRKDTFDSLDDAFDVYARMITETREATSDPIPGAVHDRLHEWLDAHLIDNPDAGKDDGKGIPERALTLKSQREVIWAFIAWNTARP